MSQPHVVTVVRRAIVTARFTENVQEHHGSCVTSYLYGSEAFGFRAFNEALARHSTSTLSTTFPVQKLTNFRSGRYADLYRFGRASLRTTATDTAKIAFVDGHVSIITTLAPRG